jgi:hypothetical protein
MQTASKQSNDVLYLALKKAGSSLPKLSGMYNNLLGT